MHTGRLLVTLVHLRTGLTREALGVITRSGSSTIRRATGEIRPLLAERGFAVSQRPGLRLRTPLGRLRQTLEDARERAKTTADYDAATDAAIAEADDLLETFSALLRIAQVEAGAQRKGFSDVDLSELVHSVAEVYQPAAEDSEHRLSYKVDDGIHLAGDRPLLAQMQTIVPGSHGEGMGLYRLPSPCKRFFWGHTGGTPGYVTFAAGSCDGRRFFDESIVDNCFEAANALLRQPGQVAFGVIDASLRENRAARVADGRLAALRRRVELFGFHLAKLDVRLHADELHSDSERVPATVGAVARARDEHGPEALDTLIVSGTASAADVLAALDVTEDAGLELSLVPLFETIASLRSAAGIVEELLDEPRFGRLVEAVLACPRVDQV